MQVKISVVIPTYKRPALLLKCLTALNEQSFPTSNFEVIVVSDGPDEQTEKCLIKWISQKKLNLIYLYTPEKSGPAATRNMGWHHAKAELIAFTDDDCLPDKNWLKCIEKANRQQPYIAFTGATKVPLNLAPNDFANNTAQLQQAEFITANCACTKAALTLVGGFDERFKLAWREDSDLQFQLLLHSIPILHLKEAIVVHPVRNAPWGVSIKEQKKGIYDALLYKKHPQLYRSKVQPNTNWNYYLTITLWILLGVFCYLYLLPAILITVVLLGYCIALFLYKRLKNTSKSISHITEMLLTSMLIPFFSVYWRIYGAIKFRVFFI